MNRILLTFLLLLAFFFHPKAQSKYFTVPLSAHENVGDIKEDWVTVLQRVAEPVADEHQNNNQLNALKNKLYGQLVVENINPDSIFINIAEVQRNIEKIHFDHFKDIKKLCTKDQMQAFDSLSKELAEIFSLPRPHKK